MSWLKPWEVHDEMMANLEEWANDVAKSRKKSKPKPDNYKSQPAAYYTVEYSKSSRASCKLCTSKISKSVLRVGKYVRIEVPTAVTGSTMGTVWFHYDCFWDSKNTPHHDDPSRESLSSFQGISSLSVEDQQKVHLQITGSVMPETKVQDAIEAEEQNERDGVFVDSDPFIIAKALLEKWLYNVAKAPELKSLVQECGLNVVKGKTKKNDNILLINKQSFDKIPQILKLALGKYLTNADLKTILTSLNMKVSGTKPQLLTRFVYEFLINNQPASSNPITSSDVLDDKENTSPVPVKSQKNSTTANKTKSKPNKGKNPKKTKDQEDEEEIIDEMEVPKQKGKTANKRKVQQEEGKVTSKKKVQKEKEGEVFQGKSKLVNKRKAQESDETMANKKKAQQIIVVGILENGQQEEDEIENNLGGQQDEEKETESQQANMIKNMDESSKTLNKKKTQKGKGKAVTKVQNEGLNDTETKVQNDILSAEMKEMVIKSPKKEDQMISRCVVEYATKNLRIKDLREILSELDVNHKKVTKKSALIDLLIQQDLTVMNDVVSASVTEFATTDDVTDAGKSLGLDFTENESHEHNIEAMLKEYFHRSAIN